MFAMMARRTGFHYRAPGDAEVVREAAGNELEPISQRDLRGSGPAVRSSGEFEAHGRQQVAAELRVLPSAVPHARLQREADGLALGSAALRDVLPVAVLRKLGCGDREAILEGYLEIARMARRPLANKAFDSEVIRPMLMSCV